MKLSKYSLNTSITTIYVKKSSFFNLSNDTLELQISQSIRNMREFLIKLQDNLKNLKLEKSIIMILILLMMNIKHYLLKDLLMKKYKWNIKRIYKIWIILHHKYIK